MYAGSFPGNSAGNESACNVGDLGLIPGLGQPSGEGQNAGAFLPGESPGTEQPACYGSWGRKELDVTEPLSIAQPSTCMQRAHLRGHYIIQFTGQDVGLIPPLFVLLGACLMLLLHSFVAKQVCLVLWLSEPVFLSAH